MVTIEISEEAPNDWNEMLLNSPYGTEFQTKEYALYLKEALKWKPIFLKFINESGKVVGQLMISITSASQEHIIKKIFKNRRCSYRWVNGPVVFESNYNNQISECLKNFLINLESKVQGSEHPLLNGILEPLKDSFKLIKWGTFLVDLSKDREIIWNSLDKHSVRKNIKRAEEKEIWVKEMTEHDLKSYIKIRQDKINEKKPPKSSILKLHWEILNPVGLRGFLAYKNDEPVGAITFSSFNRYIVESGIARSSLDLENRYYAQDLLKWKIIEWGINNKCKFFDLAGVNPNPQNKKEEGILRYKKKWGGVFTIYNKINS